MLCLRCQAYRLYDRLTSSSWRCRYCQTVHTDSRRGTLSPAPQLLEPSPRPDLPMPSFQEIPPMPKRTPKELSAAITRKLLELAPLLAGIRELGELLLESAKISVPETPIGTIEPVCPRGRHRGRCRQCPPKVR